MNRPLDFCMISTFYPPYNFGGDGIFVHRLSNELARRGHRVDVVHCTDAYRLLARREPQASYADHPNVTVHGLRSPFGFLSPLATQQTGFPLFKSSRIRQILAKGFDGLSKIATQYSPSSLEIIAPKEVKLKSNQLQQGLLDIAALITTFTHAAYIARQELKKAK